jgi:hypothetical protein
MAEAGLPVAVAEVVEDRKRGLVARLRRTGTTEDAAVDKVLGAFTVPWEWSA